MFSLTNGPFGLAFGSDDSHALLQSAGETVDAPLTPLFRTNFASEATLTAYKIPGFDGHTPDRKTWNFEQAQERLTNGFTLKTVPNRDWKLARKDTKKWAKGQDPFAPEPLEDPYMPRRSSTLGADGALGLSQSEPKLRRVDKYYMALMKEQREREELKCREAHAEFLAKAEKAARRARKEAERKENVKDDNRSDDSFSDKGEEEEEEEESDHEDPGPMKPYPGVMKVEVEVAIMRAPGVDESSEEFSEKVSTATPSTARSSATHDNDNEFEDWSAELQALQEQFAEPVKEEESETDSLPDGLDGRGMGNIDANDAKRVALGLGGTAFFVPDVERYALAPSLLPPPPREVGRVWKTGKKRLKMKPRLPLEVSRHRWRDEHPYGCPVEDEFTPNIDMCRNWEDKVRQVELYGSLNAIITQMRKPDATRGRKAPKEDGFDQMLDKELRNSTAWKQYIKRQRLLELAREAKHGGGKKVDHDALLEAVTAAGSTSVAPQEKGDAKPKSADSADKTKKPKSADSDAASKGSGDPRLQSVTAGLGKGVK